MKRTHQFEYIKYENPGDMPEEVKTLVEQARKACDTAYAPYSNFHVGAAARLRSGRVVTGSNQESEVFPAGVCAERNLLFNWQAHHTEDPIETIAIYSVPSQVECYPCGICRQVLADTEKRQGGPMRVIMASDKSATEVSSASLLLPFQFNL